MVQPIAFVFNPCVRSPSAPPRRTSQIQANPDSTGAEGGQEKRAFRLVYPERQAVELFDDGYQLYVNELAIYGLRGGKLVRLEHLPVLDLDTPC